jgi:ABC-type lipoprotein release transport system permease subunit
MLAYLAWKNIWRNRKRSIIILSAIALGLWGGIFSGAVWSGMSESMVENAIDRNLGHIQIHNPVFFNDYNLDEYIKNPEKIVDFLNKTPNVKAVTRRMIVDGMASSPTSAIGVKIVGIDTTEENAVTTLFRQTEQGRFFGAGKRNEIVIGLKLSEKLKLKVGSKIILSFQDEAGELTSISCRIVGIYHTSSSVFDQSHVFMDRKVLNGFISDREMIHEIAVRLNKAQYLNRIDDILKKQFPEPDIKTWKEIAPELAYTSAMMDNFTYIFIGIILFALLFGIVNTMLMSIIERTREIGILMAVGMKRWKVFVMILFESLYISFVGAIGGIFLATISIQLSNQKGLDFSVVAKGFGKFGTSHIIFPYISDTMYISIIVMVFITANLAALYPAWKAIHLQPSDAIRSY